MWRPAGGVSRLTWRRLRVLVDGLPPESLTKTAIRDGMSLQEWASRPDGPQAWGPWSHEAHLLAGIRDGIASLTWVTQAQWAKQPGPRPELTPRPGVGEGPLAAVAAVRKTGKARAEAALIARVRLHGAAPTQEQIQAVLDEMNGGDGDD